MRHDRVTGPTPTLGTVVVCLALVFALTTPARAQDEDARLNEAATLVEQARALEKEGKFKEAIQPASKAAALIEQARGGDHDETASALAYLGRLQNRAGAYAQAVQSLRARDRDSREGRRR